MANFRFKNDTLAPLVNWGDVINDLKEGEYDDAGKFAENQKAVRASLKKHLIQSGEALARGVKKTFNASSLSIPAAPPAGQSRDYNPFSKVTPPSLSMYQILFAYGWNKEYSYGVKAIDQVLTPTASDPSPAAFAVVCLAYIGQLTSAFLKFASDDSKQMSWHQAAIVWASMQALGNFYKTVMNFLKVAKDVKFPLVIDPKKTDLDLAFKALQSGAMGANANPADSTSDRGDYNFEPYNILLQLITNSLGTDGKPKADLLCDSPQISRPGNSTERASGVSFLSTGAGTSNMGVSSDGTSLTGLTL